MVQNSRSPQSPTPNPILHATPRSTLPCSCSVHRISANHPHRTTPHPFHSLPAQFEAHVWTSSVLEPSVLCSRRASVSSTNRPIDFFPIPPTFPMNLGPHSGRGARSEERGIRLPLISLYSHFQHLAPLPPPICHHHLPLLQISGQSVVVRFPSKPQHAHTCCTSLNTSHCTPITPYTSSIMPTVYVKKNGHELLTSSDKVYA